MAITLDYEYTTGDQIGERGMREYELQEALATFRQYYQELQSAKGSDALGFSSLPHQDEADVRAITELADQVRSEVKNVVIIGIGGSDLGARAVHRALNHQFYNLREESRNEGPRLFFVGDTTDPVALQEVIDVVDWQSATIVVISKSGNTVEQMSTFLYLRTLLESAVGDTTPERIIMVTDPETGTLREMVKTKGYRSLSVPSTVGGRFSVLTAVGLFPLAVAGIDIARILEGAKAMDIYDSQHPAGENMVFLYAILQHMFYRKGQHISVMMPYTYSLREMGFWFRQLWAESLGKQMDLDGNTVETGPTPIAAVGPTDQHSQMQLYMEGPYDKILSFLTVKESPLSHEVPHDDSNEAIGYLGGHQFAKILAAEQQSSAYALAKAGRPSLNLILDSLDAEHIGQLLYFFELAVAYMGSFLNVNTFDQPGVELGKKYMYGLLGREGFSEFSVPEGTHHTISNS